MFIIKAERNSEENLDALKPHEQAQKRTGN